MRVNGIIPNLPVSDPAVDRDFYTEFLELNAAFEYGGVAGFASPSNPAARVNLRTRPSGSAEPDDPVISVQVSDVRSAFAEAQRRGYEIVYPLTEEAFGPHRFYVRTPGGTVVNLIEHDN
jgi:catechol 2,3-dioxygenase-like lactoylglutathione lyase family enzyme